MENKVKLFIRRFFHFCGFEVIRANKTNVRFENFENLVNSYEYQLNITRKDIKICKDENRTKILGRLLGTPPSEAYYIIYSLYQSKEVEGDICEFGVAQGETSSLIANEIREQDKILHLFDSFKGLPKPSERDKLIDDIFSLGSIDAYKGKMESPVSFVLSRLSAIDFPEDRFIIHKGFFEEIIGSDDKLPDKVSFAYVDFDFYEPTKIVLEFLDRVTTTNSIIIVDDYGYFSSGVKEAVDEFIVRMNRTNLIYDLFIPDIDLGYFAIIRKVGKVII